MFLKFLFFKNIKKKKPPPAACHMRAKNLLAGALDPAADIPRPDAVAGAGGLVLDSWFCIEFCLKAAGGLAVFLRRNSTVSSAIRTMPTFILPRSSLYSRIK